MKNVDNDNREIELKIDIPSLNDYKKLLKYIGKIEETIFQTNIFFDTPQRQISQLGYALRLRIEDTRGLITLKSAKIQKENAAIREEIEAVISLEHALEIQQCCDFTTLDIPSIKLLQTLTVDLNTIVPTLQFKNERLIKDILLENKVYTFEVDQTTYADNSIVYELEIELEKIDEIEKTISDLQKLFKSLDIEFLLMKKSKFERALEIANLL